jgi:hypothetical protein
MIRLGTFIRRVSVENQLSSGEQSPLLIVYLFEIMLTIYKAIKLYVHCDHNLTTEGLF